MIALMVLFGSFLVSDIPGGKISGKVVSAENGMAVSSAIVTLISRDEPLGAVRTNPAGNFSFTGLDPGRYTLRVRKTGFDDFFKEVVVNDNFTVRIQIPFKHLAEKTKSAVTNGETPKEQEPAATSTPTVQPAAVELIPVAADQPAGETAPDSTNEETQFEEFPDLQPEPVGGLKAIIKNIEYPELAKRMNIEGQVVVKILVSAEGEPIRIDILKKAHPVLNDAAISTIYKSQFQPAVHQGRKVSAFLTLPVHFRLK